MMNTDIMRQLVAEAELGNKDMPTATTAAKKWGFDEKSLSDFRYSSNAIYFFRQSGIPRFMRLSWVGDRDLALIEAELDYLAYLADHNFPVVQSVKSTNGKRIEPVSSPYAHFNAVTFTAARGKQLTLDEMNDNQIQKWGHLLGHLHNLSTEYRTSPLNQRQNWNQILASSFTWIPDINIYTHKFLAEAKEWLATLPRDSEDYGLIHWDFEPDNLTWQDDEIEVIDFDDSAYFWYAADIAFALDDVLDEPPEKARHIINHLLIGYQTVRAIDHLWIQKLPYFVRLMRVLKVARVYHAFENPHPDLDPLWLVNLKSRLSGAIQAEQAKFRQPFTSQLSVEELAIWEPIVNPPEPA